MRFIKYKAVDRQIEPFDKNWISITFQKNNNFIEFYTEPHPITDYLFNKQQDNYIISMKNDLLIKTFFTICDYAKTIFQYSSDVNDVLVLLKIEDKYVSYSFFKKSSQYNNKKISLEHSDNEFINIKYSHPKMTNSIYLELDNSMYVEKNSLFTPAFVRRLLEYQLEEFVFDMDYELVLMDKNINMVELNSKQYIVLEKDSYNIVNVNSHDE
jgi:hypothetical protein